MSKNQFTGTATQPQRNRKFCQFNKDQYCIFDSEKIGNGEKIGFLPEKTVYSVSCRYLGGTRCFPGGNRRFSTIADLFTTLSVRYRVC